MSVNFESVKKAWLERMIEGHLTERPGIHEALNIEKRIRSLNQKLLLRDLEMAFSYAVILFAFYLIFVFVSAPKLRIAVALILCGFLPTLVAFGRVLLRSRNPHCELPRKLYLMDQKDKIEARIRFMRRASSWYLLPVYGAYVLLLISMSAQFWQIVLSATAMALLNIFAYYCLVKPRIQNLLKPYLYAIKQRLSEYQEIESEMP